MTINNVSTTTSAYFVLLKPFSYQNVQLFQDIPGMTFLFSTLYTFYNIYTFSYFFIIELYGSFASNALHSLCSLKPLCSHILYATDTIQTLNKTEDFELFLM